MEQINKLIEIESKKLSLLEELKTRIEYDTKDYDLIQPIKNKKHFMLFEIKTGNNLLYGTPKEVKAYLNLRAIENDRVMNTTLLKTL
jgi:hypothetical protein